MDNYTLIQHIIVIYVKWLCEILIHNNLLYNSFKIIRILIYLLQIIVVNRHIYLLKN